MRRLLKILVIILVFISSNILALDLKSPVIDKTNTLSTQEVDTLSKDLWQWHDQGLMQGAVVMIKTTAGEDIFDYGMKIFERWQLGNKDSNNGLLIIVAKEDHKIRIITGYGLEGVLPDISVKRIIDQNITPEFKKNAYFTGIHNGLQAINKQITADPETREKMIAADQAMKALLEKQKTVGGIFSVGIIIFNILCNLLLKIISIFRKKSAQRLLISSLSVAGITIFVATFYGIGLSTLLPPAVIAILIGAAVSDENRGNNRSSHYVFPQDRDEDSFSGFSSSSSRTYSGGGGSSGGGGAGGSW